MFLNKIRNIFVSRTQNLCPQQMLRARANGETFVLETMCPRLPVALVIGEFFASLGEISEEKMAFRNCKSRFVFIRLLRGE